MTIKLSTLAVVWTGLGLPHIYGLLKPEAYAAALRKFPRSLTWGYALTLLGTAWFLYNLHQESIADLAAAKNILFIYSRSGAWHLHLRSRFPGCPRPRRRPAAIGQIIVDTGRLSWIRRPGCWSFRFGLT